MCDDDYGESASEDIVRALLKGPEHRGMLAAKAGVSDTAGAQALSKLRNAGVVTPLGKGMWQLREDTDRSRWPAPIRRALP